MPEPDGYRTDDYRAPVPATLAGARVLTTAEAEAIWRAKHGRFHRRAAARAKAAKSSRRHGLARQAAAQHSRQRLAAGHRLRQARGGDGRLSAARDLSARPAATRAALLVVYCQANCWMSWNAAKRILSYGYSNVAWYPDGTDGWERASLPIGGVAAGAAGGRRKGASRQMRKRRQRWYDASAIPSPAGSMRPSANRRWSIAVGTSQTNLITRRRSSKIRVCQTS